VLLERLFGATSRPLIATDVSATVLSRVRARHGRDRAEYVVADARELPFEDASIPTLVSHVGLANVADSRRLLRELRRVGRELVATHVFYPKRDDENRRVARELGLEALLFRDEALSAFADAGWAVDVEHEREVLADPTPPSALVEGVRIDALPAVATRIHYCVLVAR
jgi:SAM-dependent methyltransferase